MSEKFAAKISLLLCLILFTVACTLNTEQGSNDSQRITSQSYPKQASNDEESISSMTNSEIDKFIFTHPEYDVGNKKEIIIESRENKENLQAIPNIDAVIENGYSVVKNYVIFKTPHTSIYYMGGQIFNESEYLTYIQYEDNSVARVATYYMDITGENVYLFQEVYHENSQYDRLILLND